MTFTSVASAAIVPPANLTGLVLVGFAWRRRAWGRGLAVVTACGLFLLSLPVVADTLRNSLHDGSDGTRAAESAGAIVVLGAALLGDALAAHDDAPGPLRLQRLRQAAVVARKTGLPVLVSGAIVDSAAPPVGDIMARRSSPTPFPLICAYDRLGLPWLADAVERMTWRSASRVLAVTAVLRDQISLGGVDEARIEVVANGIVPERFSACIPLRRSLSEAAPACALARQTGRGNARRVAGWAAADLATPQAER